MHTTFYAFVMLAITKEKGWCFFMKRIRGILLILTLICGTQNFVQQLFTRNALTVITESLSATKQTGSVFTAVALLALSLCFYPVMQHAYQLWKVRLRQVIGQKFSKEILQKFERMEFHYLDTPDTYDLCTRVTKTATDKIFEGNIAWFELLQNLIIAVTLSVLVINIAWYTLPCSLITVLPMILLNHRKARDMQKAEEERAYYDRKSTYAASLLLHKDSLMETKVFGSRDYLQKIWSDNLIQSMKRKREISLHAGKQGAVVNMVYTWAGLPMSFFVLWQVTRGRISLADYVVLSQALAILGLTVVYGVAGSFGKIKQYQLFQKDFESVMNMKDCEYSKETGMERFQELRFEHVSFSYPNTEKEILHDVSFVICRGEKVAIAGVNGAGKSTIIKLILGLYAPTKGKITINGKEVSSLSPTDRCQLISVVFQDYTKYHMKIRENLAFGNLSKMKEDEILMNGIKQSGLKEVIDQLKGGLDHRIGVEYGEGSNLSEGQWQKLNLGRMYASEANLLLLDEPTAAMDAKAESELYHHFVKLSDAKSCILISHRLGSTRICDRILVLADGRIVETGCHEELIKAGGIYAEMFRAQSSWYTEDDKLNKVS